MTNNKDAMSPWLNLKCAIAKNSAISNSLLSRNDIIHIAIDLFGRDALEL